MVTMAMRTGSGGITTTDAARLNGPGGVSGRRAQGHRAGGSVP